LDGLFPRHFSAGILSPHQAGDLIRDGTVAVIFVGWSIGPIVGILAFVVSNGRRLAGVDDRVGDGAECDACCDTYGSNEQFHFSILSVELYPINGKVEKKIAPVWITVLSSNQESGRRWDSCRVFPRIDQVTEVDNYIQLSKGQLK